MSTQAVVSRRLFPDVEPGFDEDVLREVGAFAEPNVIVVTTVHYPGGSSVFGMDYEKFCVHFVVTIGGERRTKSFPITEKSKSAVLEAAAMLRAAYVLITGEDITMREHSFRLQMDGPRIGHP